MTASGSALPARRSGPELVADVTLLLVALAAGLGTARLTTAPTTAHVLAPIAACVVAGHLVVSLVRRLRMPDPVPSVIGVLAVALVAVWTLLPSATRTGFPTVTTWRTLIRLFSDAGGVIRSQPTPVPATSGVVLCLAAGAGLAAVFARTLWSWQEVRPPGARRPLVALFPTFGLFCYTALLSSDIDRVTGATLFLAASLLFLAVADRPELSGRRILRSGTSAALAMAAAAVVVPLAASPGLAGLRLDAIPFGQGGAKGGGPGGPGTGIGDVEGIGALNLIDDMRAVLTTRSTLLMFSAISRTPTYWQVAILSHFNGTSWLPDPATKAAAQLAPQLTPVTLPVLPEPTATQTFTVNIAIASLRSTLLPVPPATVSVGNANSVQVEPGIGVVQPFANPEDLTFDATARLPTALGTSPAPTLADLDASVPAADLAPYLALPSSMPSDVVALAHQIVAHARGPEAEATALVRFFTAAKRFRYTLDPPSAGTTNALSAFLFSTRAGFCQQFAGAFAVLARLDGLPTRLAVGFTTGATTERDTYNITGADAHSWPQVYLGPGAGWVSFEPTPATTDEALGAGVFSGAPTTTAPPHPSSATPTTISDKRLLGQGIQPAVEPKGLGATGRHPSTTTPSSSWGSVAAVALGAVAVLVALALVGPWLWRRRRPRLRRRPFARARAPGPEILARWEQAASVLARTGLGRRESETLEEHAARLAFQAGRPTPAVASAFIAHSGTAVNPDAHAARALEAYRALAELAARASYAPDPCTHADVTEARRLSEALREALRRGAPVADRTTARP